MRDAGATTSATLKGFPFVPSLSVLAEKKKKEALHSISILARACPIICLSSESSSVRLSIRDCVREIGIDVNCSQLYRRPISLPFLVPRDRNPISSSFRTRIRPIRRRWRVSKFKRAPRRDAGGVGARRELRNYGRWKTGDLPDDRHLGRRAPGTGYRVTRVASARRSKETNRFTFVPVATNASVQSIRVILPRVHCLRIRRCVSRRVVLIFSTSERASERVGPSHSG